MTRNIMKNLQVSPLEEFSKSKIELQMKKSSGEVE